MPTAFIKFNCVYKKIVFFILKSLLQYEVIDPATTPTHTITFTHPYTYGGIEYNGNISK